MPPKINFFLSNPSFRVPIRGFTIVIGFLILLRAINGCNNSQFFGVFSFIAFLSIISGIFICLPMLKMYKFANLITENAETQIEKAKLLYNWTIENIEYDFKLLGRTQSFDDMNSSRSFYTRKGLCGQQASMLNTLYKAIGLNSFVAAITKDCMGEIVDHACVCLIIDDDRIFVDPTYKIFGATHKEYSKIWS